MDLTNSPIRLVQSPNKCPEESPLEPRFFFPNKIGASRPFQQWDDSKASLDVTAVSMETLKPDNTGPGGVVF